MKSNALALIQRIDAPESESLLASLYGKARVSGARKRYVALLEGQAALNGDADVRVFTAAGRTELGGNHTDHNRGKVLAASIQLDAVAIVSKRDAPIAYLRSTGYPDVQVDLSDLAPRPEEQGATEALVRGIAAAFAKQGVIVGGFTANADSTVLPGSGLSSSAALEVLLAKIFDSLYSAGTRSPLELAQIGQWAENEYFGKPCGLMDQTACAFGGAVAIDFADPAKPLVKPIPFDLECAGFALCVVNTRGSHADLTADYAAIPEEMKAVARFFGKSVLRELDCATVIAHAARIRAALGDRALLRALHFFNENARVDAMRDALDAASGSASPAALRDYLTLVTQSGASSWELLQNSYSPNHPRDQGIALALALTRDFLERCPMAERVGAYRVHGGGFAGTIQAYIPLDAL
ncbi:MAG: galactokinase, partial [Treponema sp.]|nr:galactokinase [Treponema sp.]